MALAIVAEGTQTATLGTEHTLATSVTGKTDVLGVDTGALANGETVELTIYTIIRAAGVERIAWQRSYSHVQAEPQKYSWPVPANISIKATLKQTGGVGRAFPFSLLSVD